MIHAKTTLGDKVIVLTYLTFPEEVLVGFVGAWLKACRDRFKFLFGKTCPRMHVAVKQIQWAHGQFWVWVQDTQYLFGTGKSCASPAHKRQHILFKSMSRDKAYRLLPK